jgi:hypothetical protein
MQNEMNNEEYLIQALLAELKNDDCEIHNYDELLAEEEPEAEKVNDDQNDDVKDLLVCQPETGYDWDNLTDVEEEENSVEATCVLPSFIETVSIDERAAELKSLFENEFPIGKSFLDKADARFQIQKFSRANNIPFETIRSDATYIKMVCKHFGCYRTGRKDKEGNIT